jgi:hypothetical protein
MSVSIARDLRALFGPVRFQAKRPTCLAFAASDTHSALRGAWAELSCEYLFYMAQKRAARLPTQGATLSASLETLKLDGQPLESGWPYLLQLPSPVSTWAPPDTIGTVHTRTGSSQSASVEQVIAALDGNRPVIVLMRLSRSFNQPGVDGLIDAGPEEAPEPQRRHAIIAVGYGLWDSHRVILIRNSWGAKWANGGYAWVTERFMTPRIFNMALLV